MLTRKKPKKTPLILRRKLCFSHAEAVTDFPTNNYIYIYTVVVDWNTLHISIHM